MLSFVWVVRLSVLRNCLCVERSSGLLWRQQHVVESVGRTGREEEDAFSFGRQCSPSNVHSQSEPARVVVHQFHSSLQALLCQTGTHHHWHINIVEFQTQLILLIWTWSECDCKFAINHVVTFGSHYTDNGDLLLPPDYLKSFCKCRHGEVK